MPRFKMPPKPRLPFCWWCSRRLYGTIHAKFIVYNPGPHEVLTHKSCASAFRAEFPAAQEAK